VLEIETPPDSSLISVVGQFIHIFHNPWLFKRATRLFLRIRVFVSPDKKIKNNNNNKKIQKKK